MITVQRRSGETIITSGSMTLKTRLINRATFNRLRKDAEAGTLRLHHVLAILKR